MKRHVGIVSMILALAASCRAGAAAQPASRPAGRTITLEHLRIDLGKRRITLDAEVCLRKGMLEFLLCKAGTKEHESILRTSATGANLHAALLSLGLTPGKPARWSGRGKGAIFLPPQGAGIRISLCYNDRAGKVRRIDAGDWLASAAGRSADAPKHWVFVGSDILPGNDYWADLDGGIISVANFASAVIDVPFSSSSSNKLLEFTADTPQIPPLGTQVRVILEPVDGAEKADHARALLQIDRLGRYSLDGRPIAPDGLRKWAMAYVARHAEGMVVLRSSPRALCWDVERARRELSLGGVREFEEQRLGPADGILPRTPDEARASLAEWSRKFSDPESLLVEPGEQAEATLRQIERELGKLDARKALWEEYATHLRQALGKYKAATQPSDSKADGGR